MISRVLTNCFSSGVSCVVGMLPTSTTKKLAFVAAACMAGYGFWRMLKNDSLGAGEREGLNHPLGIRIKPCGDQINGELERLPELERRDLFAFLDVFKNKHSDPYIDFRKMAMVRKLVSFSPESRAIFVGVVQEKQINRNFENLELAIDIFSRTPEEKKSNWRQKNLSFIQS